MLQKAESWYGFDKFFFNTPREVTMGYEYEDHIDIGDQDRGEDLARQMACLLPTHFKVQYEGFGPGAGCEIKSVIAPLFLHKQFIRKFVEKIPLSTLSNNETNGGIHVNISVTDAALDVWKKVFSFLHNPVDRLSFFKMSKRTSRSFDVNCPSRPNGIRNMDRLVYLAHYNIINWENPERFEFRLFAAHPTLLLPALEMADSLFKYAHDVDVITMAGWRQYITRFKKYEHIKEHCIATLDRTPS